MRIPDPLEFVGEYGWSIVGMLTTYLVILLWDVAIHSPIPIAPVEAFGGF